MSRPLRFEAVYPQSPERVWRALTSSAELAEWLMENDFEPRAGHQFHFRLRGPFGRSRLIPCEVLQVEAPRLLAFTWGSPESVVTLTLEGAPEGTRLLLEHRGFRGVRGLAMHWLLGRGWRRKISERLPAVLARFGSAESGEQSAD